jgi:hypothetical protein
MRVVKLALLVVWLAGCGGSGTAALDAAASPTDGEGGGATRGGDRSGPLSGVDGEVTVPDAGPADAPVDKRAKPDAEPDAPSPLADAAPDQSSPSDAEEADASPDVCATKGLCDQYAADYRKALAKAQSCSTLTKEQCGIQAASNLFCGCPLWVTSSTELDMIREMSEKTGCSKCRRVCPGLLCRELKAGTCRAGGVALPLLTGTCADVNDP